VTYLTKTPFRLWIFLIGLTISAWAVFEGDAPNLLAGTVVVFIAAIKSRLVILHYMEAKNAPKKWRTLYETWNFTCAALIIIGNAVTLTSHQ
jgi:hypothetical protein